MLDQERIQLMARMAAYEKSDAKEELKISSYFKKDYASLHTWYTILWITVGYMLIVALFLISQMEFLLDNLVLSTLLPIGAALIGGYLALLIVYCICANVFYRMRYNKAKRHMKGFYKDLQSLRKMEMKEKK